MTKQPIEQVTMSTKEAAQRHKGVTALGLSKLCLRGKYLAKIHGGASRVPEHEKGTALFARKVGQIWHIPIAELDRVFLPPERQG